MQANLSQKSSANNVKKNIVNHREYNIIIEKNEYNLRVEVDNEYIYFTISKLNESIEYIYKSKMDLSTIINKLELNSSIYSSLESILKIFDSKYKKNKISININDENSCNLLIKILNALEEEITKEIKLYKEFTNNDDKFNILFNKIKNIEMGNTNINVNGNIEDNKYMEKINKIVNEMDIKMNKREDEFKEILTEKDNMINEMNEKIINQDKKINEIMNKKLEEIENKFTNQLNKLNEEINKQNEIIKKQEEIIKENKNKINQNKNNEENLNNINLLKKLENEIDIIKKEKEKNNNNDINIIKNEIKEINNKINSNENKVKNLENIIKEKENIINNIKEDNIKINNTNKKINEDIINLKKDIGNIQKVFNEINNNINIIKKNYFINNEINIKKAIEENENKYKKIMLELNNLTKELQKVKENKKEVKENKNEVNENLLQELVDKFDEEYNILTIVVEDEFKEQIIKLNYDEYKIRKYIERKLAE